MEPVTIVVNGRAVRVEPNETIPDDGRFIYVDWSQWNLNQVKFAPLLAHMAESLKRCKPEVIWFIK